MRLWDINSGNKVRDLPGHALTVDGREYAFFYEPLRLASEAPWLVGGYVPNADATPELVRWSTTMPTVTDCIQVPHCEIAWPKKNRR